MALSVLITGAEGMLGSDLVLAFGSKAKVVACNRAILDITDSQKVGSLLSQHRPDLVINAAAFTDVDKAETHEAQAFAVNAEGPKNLAKLCQSLGIVLVHYSTDQVFSGTSETPYRESDMPSPINAYGRSKREGELAVLESPHALVLRVQWLYGKKKDRFTRLAGMSEFSPFVDQWGSPTWTRDVAQWTSELVGKNANGIYHLTYDDAASWAEVFAFAKETRGYSVKLLPKRTEEVSLPAKRPRYSVLSNEKARATLGHESLGSWKTALGEFLLGGARRF